MAKKEVKKLTTELLKKQDSKLNEVQEFSITIGEDDFLMTHDVKFRKSKQHKVLDDLVLFFNEGAKQNIAFLDMATPYTGLLIIKHFTSLDVSDDIEEALALLNVLVDIGALANILSALPEDEVVKVYELLTVTMTRFRENLEQAEIEAQELALENKEELLGAETDGASTTDEQGE